MASSLGGAHACDGFAPALTALLCGAGRACVNDVDAAWTRPASALPALGRHRPRDASRVPAIVTRGGLSPTRNNDETNRIKSNQMATRYGVRQVAARRTASHAHARSSVSHISHRRRRRARSRHADDESLRVCDRARQRVRAHVARRRPEPGAGHAIHGRLRQRDAVKVHVAEGLHCEEHECVVTPSRDHPVIAAARAGQSNGHIQNQTISKEWHMESGPRVSNKVVRTATPPSPDRKSVV